MRDNVRAFVVEQKPEKLVAQARAFWTVGDLTRAEEYFAAAIEAGGDEQKIIPMLLAVCVQDGRYRVAVAYAENHLSRHPADVSTRFVLGTLHAALGEGAAARAELEQVTQARPADAQARYAFGVLLQDQGDRVLADRQFREYLRLAPDGAHSEQARASLLHTVPDPDARSPSLEGGAP